MCFPPSLRTLTKTLFVTLLWLLTASTVDAAPSSRHSSAAERHLSRFVFRTDPTPHFERARHTDKADDDAAIQDDAPARIVAHDGTLSSLRPIGFLVGHVDSHSRSVSFSPRSPRGPPLAS